MSMLSVAVDAVVYKFTGTTDWDLVEIRYEKLTTQIYLNEYIEENGVLVGKYDSWVGSSHHTKGIELSRKIIKTVTRDNLEGRPSYVP
ncbi:hypothetical protein [Amphritea pacifica]|uniref:Uncharacterized protein n=1 Tax=Amphritea pacifica TaxID=2811233 RepID=A0ABS2WE73_9GAMM|nr:hypothetical protein [Amphritea pacifica]MBN0989893.1 hypothetical protein [Amphritea pacifica]